MNYKELIEELQTYSPEELQQHVKFLFIDGHEDIEVDDVCSAEDVDYLTAYDGKEIYIMA